MEKTSVINVGGKAYPCYMTMGAMVRYRDMRKKEVSEIGDSVTEMCALLYCCVASGCNRERRSFDMEFMDFADSIGFDDVRKWSEMISAEMSGGGESKKKKPVK